MIPEIHARLENWASWQRTYGSTMRLGWPGRSPEQRGLELRNVMSAGSRRPEPLEPATFPPARPKQTRGYIALPAHRDEDAEAIDRAVARMQTHLRDAIKAKYLHDWSDQIAAAELRCSVATFKNLVNVAHGWLDGHFSDRAPLPRWRPRASA